ncbi:hypothetical protein [Kutzneria sp. NPDC052558]|uniref:hypothetical protein n=1 Tax=Kutzneria sp. NPDC052558 TaxID=3364121 RepID=UPI0037CAA486
MLRQVPTPPADGLLGAVLAGPVDVDPVEFMAGARAADCTRVALGSELALLDSAFEASPHDTTAASAVAGLERPAPDEDIAARVATLRHGATATTSIDPESYPLLARLLETGDDSDPVEWVVVNAAPIAADRALRVAVDEFRSWCRDVGEGLRVPLDLPFSGTGDFQVRPTGILRGTRGLSIESTARLPRVESAPRTTRSATWQGFARVTDDRGMRYLMTDFESRPTGGGVAVNQKFWPVPAEGAARLTLEVDGYEVTELRGGGDGDPAVTFSLTPAHMVIGIELPGLADA